MTGKKGIIWLVVSCLMVFALLLASCAGEVTKKTEVTPPTTEVTPATKEVAPAEKAGMVKLSLKKLDGTPVEKWVEAPKYGGTFILAQNAPDTTWDDFFASSSKIKNMQIVANELLGGDWAKGPAGTTETTWFAGEFYWPFETGELAASWEIPDANTIIYHIRQGVHWALDPKSEASRLVNGRELTAADVAFTIMRKLSNPKSYLGKRDGIGLWFISATAVDKYTVVVKGKEQLVGTRQAFREISDKNNINPPEVIQKYGDMRDWRNVVGTGAFMVVDSVEGSSATFQRNPNYWEKDPLFPPNQLPYVDTVKALLIPDQSTRYAGLRTGKVDFVRDIPWEDAESLLQTNPELIWSREVVEDADPTLAGRVDTKPFTDIRVRRALAMAIDRPAILRDYYRGNAQLPSLFIVDIPEFKAIYTPLEQLPQSTRELYEYHPDKAKQLLAEAGYPQGFKFTAVLHKDQVDMASIYKADLAKVGVELVLDVREFGVWDAITKGWPKQHKEAAFGDVSTTSVVNGTSLFPGQPGNIPVVDDPVINDYKAKLTSFALMQNQAERDRLAKELALYVMSQAYMIEPPAPYIYYLWSPWVKNFYGSPNSGVSDRDGAYIYLWLDQELKKKMVGR